jgi:hypothetical protein
LYTFFFPGHRIEPQNSCNKIVSLLSSESKSRSITLPLNHYIGLIDRDFRNNQNVDYLKSQNIYVLEVAAVENLFCSPEVIQWMFGSSVPLDNLFSAANKIMQDNKKFLQMRHLQHYATNFTFNTSKNIWAFALIL